jgi:hypothetical protein
MQTDTQRKTEPAVNACDVGRQVWRDWTDKEVQKTYTTTYIWMTNQLGHFTLGFLLTFAIVWIVGVIRGSIPSFGWIFIIALAEFVFWTGKESLDWIHARRDAAGNPFRFDGLDVASDAATAVWFITVGIVVALVSFYEPWAALAALGAGVVCSLVPALHWLKRKLCFQQAALPFLFRLADFSGSFAPNAADGVKTINDYLADGQSEIRHLFIFGQRGAGRTSLAVAIATEHTFCVHSARYMSWAKFMETAQDTAEPEIQDGLRVWPWRTSDIVVLDDVVKVIDGRAITSAKDIAAEFGRLPAEAAWSLAQRRTVWVLGPDQTDWVTTLQSALKAAPSECRAVQVVPVASVPKKGKHRMPVSHMSGA